VNRKQAVAAPPRQAARGETIVADLARGARRVAVLVVGLFLLAAGVVLLVLPGPGLLVGMAGLAVLATEFAWARRLLARVRGHARRLSDRVRRR
jgi:uncharacterized protein (TIGR02611 family)